MYKILLVYGRAHTAFLRAHKRWQPLVPLLMDHVLLEFDPDAEDSYAAAGAGAGWSRALSIPIEARLRLLAVGLLYELCRLQQLSLADLRASSPLHFPHMNGH